jgi:hypothetical protein
LRLRVKRCGVRGAIFSGSLRPDEAFLRQRGFTSTGKES